MGVDYVLFERLAELSNRWTPKGRSVGLGRHSFELQGPFAPLYRKAMKAHGKEGKRFDYVQDDGYYELLMEKFGFGKIESMDFSDYEGATILHDLNRPIPESLENQFDFIFDGGTIEHVFNVPMALTNVFKMLKPGGRFVSANGMNGWPGHGIYQFNPELVWTFWGRTANCIVHTCQGISKVPQDNKEYRLDFPDPAITGKRLRLRGKIPNGRFYLYYEIEKPQGAELTDITLQSDYEAKWSGHENAGQTRMDGAA